MKTFELNQKQKDALEELAWLTDDEPEYIEMREETLLSFEGDVHEKIDYWLPVLEEARAEHEMAIESRDRYLEAHNKNIKRKEKVSEIVNKYILNLMLEAGIDKHNGELFSCSHAPSPGPLQFDHTFDVDKLPCRFTKMVIDPDEKAITEALMDIDSGESIVENISLPGCYIAKKEILVVL